jgi:hypothetical protein
MALAGNGVFAGVPHYPDARGDAMAPTTWICSQCLVVGRATLRTIPGASATLHSNSAHPSNHASASLLDLGWDVVENM